MRLLLTTDTVGGVWDYTATLTRELERRGHAVLLAVLGSPTLEQLAQLPEGIALECRSYRLEWMPMAEPDLESAAVWIERLARSWGAQVVHLNQLAYPAMAPFAVPTVVVAHSDVCSWFHEVRGSPPPSEWDRYLRWVGRGLARATSVVAPTRYQADLIARHFGRLPDSVIYNAADRVAGISAPKVPTALIAGRAWDPAKDVLTFDRALGILGEEAPHAVLVGSVQGPGGERFDAVHLDYRGHATPAELASWMARATAYVAPSTYEPFGLAPLEAALHGCALVLSDIGSFRELWNGCAEFFTKGSPTDLARALERVMADVSFAERMGEKARSRAISRYGVDRFVSEYVALYGQLAGAGDAAGPAKSGPVPGVLDVDGMQGR